MTISDGDDLVNEFTDELNLNDDDNCNVFSKVDKKLFNKKPNLIVLFNDESIDDEYNVSRTFDFIEEIEQKFTKNIVYLNFININKAVTYNGFLTTLNKIASSCSYSYEDIFGRFDYYKIANMSMVYVLLRFENTWKSKLTEIITKRFDLFKEFDENGLTNYEIILNLHDEVITTFPLFDEVYKSECNAVIANILNDNSQMHNDFIENELQTSSNNSIDYVKSLIRNKNLITTKFKENVKINHQTFLNNEFFCIVSYISSKKDRAKVFESNYHILKYQINADNHIIDNLFVNQQNGENQKCVVDFDEQKKIATNYMIRERENVREIKVIVKTNKFDEVFEDDC